MQTEVLVQWDYHLRPFELEKLEKAWAVSQEAPAVAKLAAWLTTELKKFPELFDEELFESSRYAVVIARKLWSPDGQ